MLLGDLKLCPWIGDDNRQRKVPNFVYQQLARSHKLAGYASGSFTWRRSLTLSIGATAVLEMAAEMPPAKKSLANDTAVSFILGCSWCDSQVTSKLNKPRLHYTTDGLHRRNGRLCSRLAYLYNPIDRDTPRELWFEDGGQTLQVTRLSANQTAEMVITSRCALVCVPGK